jgi:hypothetical protein
VAALEHVTRAAGAVAALTPELDHEVRDDPVELNGESTSGRNRRPYTRIMAAAQPTSVGSIANGANQELRNSWRTLTRAATTVAVITALAVFVWCERQNGWGARVHEEDVLGSRRAWFWRIERVAQAGWGSA